MNFIYYSRAHFYVYLFVCMCVCVCGMGWEGTSKMRQIMPELETKMASVTPIKISRNGKLNTAFYEKCDFFALQCNMRDLLMRCIHRHVPLMNSISLSGLRIGEEYNKYLDFQLIPWILNCKTKKREKNSGKKLVLLNVSRFFYPKNLCYFLSVNNYHIGK